MLIFENISLALSGLWANKMRALLTMLGIIIGIGSVITIMTVGDAVTNAVSTSMQSLGASNITVYVNTKEPEEETGSNGMKFESVRLTKELAEEDLITEEMIEGFKEQFTERIDGVALTKSLGSGRMTRGKSYANVTVDGINIDYFISNEMTLLAGRNFSMSDYEDEKKVALVTDKFVENIYGGDNQKALGQEIEIKIGTEYYSYTIAGVYEYEQNMMMMSMGSGKDTRTTVYVPLRTAQSQSRSEAVYTDITVIAAAGSDSTAMINEVKRFFNTYYRNNRYYGIEAFSMGSMIDSMMSVMSTVTLAISVIAGISLLVGGIGVMNIMLVSITERTREIGTRKALGAPNSSIRLQFIVEAMVICLIGGAIGVVLGIILGTVASDALGYPAEASVSSIIISLLFSMSIGVFFGYYPANKAAKMDPIEALRYE